MAVATSLAIAAGAAAVAGGVGNYLANKSAAERAEMLQNQSLQQWIALNVPDPKAQELVLKKFVVEGKLDPQLEHAIKADPSAFEQVTTDVGQKNAQKRALSELEDIGYKGGLRLQDKAALQEAMQDSTARDRGQRLAIESEMARRGLGGSGFDVAAQLNAQSEGADRNANNSLKVAAGAQDRALQAIMGAGDMATKYRTQDFGEQAQKATAADKINLFNTQNLQDVQQRNTGAANHAQEYNLNQAQKTSDQNTQQSNYEQEYNKKLMQQQFENQAKKTAGMTGQYGQLAQTAVQQGQNQGNLYSNMGQGLAGAALSGAQMGFQADQNALNRQNQTDFWDNYFNKSKQKGS